MPRNTEPRPGRLDRRVALGRAAEEFAANWLGGRGYAILERNYRRSWGEADIIARDPEADTTVIVEVRSRRDPRRGVDALLSVGPRKQRQLLRIAYGWLAEAEHEQDVRIDIIIVVGDPERGFRILTHLVDALEDAEFDDE